MHSATIHSITKPLGLLDIVGFSLRHHFINLTNGLKVPLLKLFCSVAHVVCFGGFVSSQASNFLSGIYNVFSSPHGAIIGITSISTCGEITPIDLVLDGLISYSSLRALRNNLSTSVGSSSSVLFVTTIISISCFSSSPLDRKSVV